MWKHIFFAVVALLVLGYLSFSDPNVTLRSSDGRWADSEVAFKGRRLDTLVTMFELYKLECQAPRAELVRATAEYWFNVFAWPSYLTSQKWRIPYSDRRREAGDYSEPECMGKGSTPADLDAAERRAKALLTRL